MKAIIGKIVSASPGTQRRGLVRMAVRFKAVALLPERAEVPAWLVDQTLAVEREVADVREVGGIGDAITLTPAESEKFLAPLTVEPAEIEGQIPKVLKLTLRWWKTESPPQFTFSALGKKITGTFARHGEIFSATVPTKDLLDASAARPFEITVVCDTLRAICPVVPGDAPGFHRFLNLRGEGYRLLNRWYAVDILSDLAGGAIVGFRERLRDVDHLEVTPITQKALDKVGHCDRILIGQDDKLPWAKLLAFTIRQREAGGARVEIEGVVDEGKNLRSAAAYRLLDALPLLVLRRDARLGAGKPDEKRKEPTDSLVPLQLGFRHAMTLEGDGLRGSHLIAPDDDRLGVIRATYENDHAHRGDWWLKDGWAMACHPLRRQVTLFLFDAERPPEMLSWAGIGFLTFEPAWPARPYRAPAGTAFTVGMSSGEIGGATLAGAWVACRARSADGGMYCAAVAKLQSPTPSVSARFTVGRESRETPVESVFVEGIGSVCFATADFPKAKRSDPLDVTVAGIPSRSME